MTYTLALNKAYVVTNDLNSPLEDKILSSIFM